MGFTPVTIRQRKLAITGGIAAVLLLLGYLVAGPRGLATAALTLPILIAARHDTQLGACLPLVLLIMIALTVLVVLIALMAGFAGR